MRESLTVAERARDEYRRLYFEMMERCRKLERGLLGQKAERLRGDDAQLSLSVLELMLDEREKAELHESLAIDSEVRAHKRHKPTGRRPIPEHLPRVDIEIVPPEVEREGRDAFEKIGEDVTEVLERRPASVVVARVIKPKFVRKGRAHDETTEVLVGDTPELPIVRCLAGLGCSPTRSSGAGKTTFRSTASKTSTDATGSISRARRWAAGTSSSRRS
jgi:hypothetical protein